MATKQSNVTIPVVPKLQTRSYQQEMFERSARENVIIAMDTGSGKTQVAVLRIAAELEKGVQDKIIWFLAPTVTLCTQQHRTINDQLPAVKTKLLTGSDNVDRWSEQRIWNAALEDVRVVVSTHAVLADALTHGFVKLHKLSLLVFDEAHHCNRKHLANRIMQDFYHPALEAGIGDVPGVLGLTASPVFRSNLKSLYEVESNLNSISITPRVHQQELMRHVHRPKFHRLTYQPVFDDDIKVKEIDPSQITSQLLRELLALCLGRRTNLHHLMPTDELKTTRNKAKSHISFQLHKFCQKALHIYSELGRWAADYFIQETITSLRSLDQDSFALNGWTQIRPAILNLLEKYVLPYTERTSPEITDDLLSNKVKTIIDFLELHDYNDVVGLIFVKQRVIVSILRSLLALHPSTKDKFRCATFVGQSINSNRQYGLPELLDVKAQTETLSEFRAKVKNVVIATDVLEEGIDVSVCNLVICFDPPANLKSFIQRRGRARDATSNFAILLPENDVKSKISKWMALEEQLIALYQEEQRTLQTILDQENVDENVIYKFRVDSTGALLTADTALAHLYHFCRRLQQSNDTDTTPVFNCKEAKDGKIVASVILPNCLTPSVQRANSLESWKTERAAIKDAAFQAYIALYHAGLINDNLLPLVPERTEISEENGLEYHSAVMPVSSQFLGLAQIAEAWEAPKYHRIRISINNDKGDKFQHVSMNIISPLPLPCMEPFKLYVDAATVFTVKIGQSKMTSTPTSSELEDLRAMTNALHQYSTSSALKLGTSEFLLLFKPRKKDEALINALKAAKTTECALEVYMRGGDIQGWIRGPIGTLGMFRFLEWYPNATGPSGNIVKVRLVRIPKRKRYMALHNLPPVLASGAPKLRDMETYEADKCSIDVLPQKYAQFGRFIPSFLRYIDVYLVAQQVSQTVLQGITINNLEHIVTAISAPSAEWITHYQRYEFIGDSVLKFISSIQLFGDHPTWPEGLLTKSRIMMISNPSLTGFALEKGLDQYIMTVAIKEKKWTPPLISSTKQPTAKRNISAKMLADVIESLIGAVYIDSNLNQTRHCVSKFLDTVTVIPPPLPQPQNHVPSTPEYSKLEKLIGYTFKNRALLKEAITHSSCTSEGITQSYQRLEFLGDAVLDLIITNQFLAHMSHLTQGEMTKMKAALVNQSVLGFFCLNLRQKCTETVITPLKSNTFQATSVETDCLNMADFLRHCAPSIHTQRVNSKARFAQLESAIKHSFANDTSPPWILLAELNSEKYYSDIIESTIGAIYIDSASDLSLCTAFVERLGLLAYANRMMSQNMDVLHPVDNLQQTLSQRVIYTPGLEPGTSPQTYFCKIDHDGERLAEVTGASNKEVAKIKAIFVALEHEKCLLNRKRKSVDEPVVQDEDEEE